MKNTRGDHEVSFDFITTDALMLQRVIGGTDATQPIQVNLNADPDRYRITLTFTGEDGKAKLQYVFANATGVSVEEDFSGETHLKGTMMFKVPIATSGGTNNAYVASTPNADEDPLPTLSPAEGSFV